MTSGFIIVTIVSQEPTSSYRKGGGLGWRLKAAATVGIFFVRLSQGSAWLLNMNCNTVMVGWTFLLWGGGASRKRSCIEDILSICNQNTWKWWDMHQSIIQRWESVNPTKIFRMLVNLSYYMVKLEIWPYQKWFCWPVIKRISLMSVEQWERGQGKAVP